jgi:hypothetical protein
MWQKKPDFCLFSLERFDQWRVVQDNSKFIFTSMCPSTPNYFYLDNVMSKYQIKIKFGIIGFKPIELCEDCTLKFERQSDLEFKNSVVDETFKIFTIFPPNLVSIFTLEYRTGLGVSDGMMIYVDLPLLDE